MSPQIVDILSDSDSDPDPYLKPLRRRLPQTDAVDLTTPPLFPNSKKKARTNAFPNPNNHTVYNIDDDTPPVEDQLLSTTPGPSSTPSVVAETPFPDTAKRPGPSSTPSVVAETPFSDASKGLLSTRPGPSSTPSVVAETPVSDEAKRPYSSGISLSPIPQFVADTPVSDGLIDKISTRKCFTSGEGLGIDQPVVADERMVELLKPEALPVKDYIRGQHSGTDRSLSSKHKSAETNTLICVDSDNESEPIDGLGVSKGDGANFPVRMRESDVESSSSLGTGSSIPIQTHLSMESADKTQTLHGRSNPILLGDETSQSDNKAETETRVPTDQMLSQNSNSIGSHTDNKTKTTRAKGASKEEKQRLNEEKKQQKEREKSLKAAEKAEAADMKKREKERKKWENGKLAVQSIVAVIDPKVVESPSIGGPLLTRFGDKKEIKFRVAANPVARSIVWNMTVPEKIAAIPGEHIEIPYVLIIYEAEEFCNIVNDGSLTEHVRSVRHHYPHHTICYLTNRLMAYVNKREQAHYKNPANCPGWKRPAIEEAFSKLATNFMNVHSRQCVDEAELAEHVVGLTSNLATCQFREKLSRLSIYANGSVIPKDCGDKNLVNKNPWLKALLAIPKVQPRFAMAIGKRYPTMKSLLSVYMDPTKSVHDKEFLLKDLMTEGLSGDRRLGEVCSKRIYRILMAKSGTIKTDEVENGAGYFGG